MMAISSPWNSGDSAKSSGTLPGLRLAEPLRVVIAEDEALIAMNIADMVRGLGGKVVAMVSNGPAAIDAAGELDPDLVLMDIRLARGTSGIAAAIDIRHRYAIPSVFLTAHSDAETRRQAEDAEPLAYLVKPLTRNALAEALNRIEYAPDEED